MINTTCIPNLKIHNKITAGRYSKKFVTTLIQALPVVELESTWSLRPFPVNRVACYFENLEIPNSYPIHEDYWF